MVVFKKITLERIALTFHLFSLFSVFIALIVLLSGGFQFQIGVLKFSATNLYNPLIYTLLFFFIGKRTDPSLSFQNSPMGRSVESIKELFRRLIEKHDSPIAFWVTLIFLNILLFVPVFILQTRDSVLIPVPPFHGPRGLWDTFLFFIRRENQDFFRLSGDFYLLVSLLVLFRRTKYQKIIQRIFITTYLFLFIYQGYESLYLKLFGQKPLFYSDLLLIRDALYLIVDVVSWKLLDAVLRIIIIIGLGMLIFRFSFRVVFSGISRIRLTKKFAGFGLTLWALIFFHLFWYNWWDDKQTIQWITPKIVENASEAIKGYKALNWEKYESFDELENITLALRTRPNIYLILVESYGKILADHPDLQLSYSQFMSEIENTLAKHGWYGTTNYSTAPISGGKSWLSAATVLSGIQIENQATYSLLTRKLTNYPHLIRVLQKEGYHTFGLYPPMRERPGFNFEFHETYYGYDTWIYQDDLEYSGEPFGWGIIPDQYSLNYVHKKYLEITPDPFFLFFSTITSHAPWYELPPFVDYTHEYNKSTINTENYNTIDSIDNTWSNTWKNINLHLREQIAIKEMLTPIDYFDHMMYQITFIADYILNKADQKSIFILIGDHQPPILTNNKSGFETPIHIICRDEQYLTFFDSYGFTRGFEKHSTNTNIIKHESIFSLFSLSLAERYGSDENENKPSYYPNGVPLSIFSQNNRVK